MSRRALSEGYTIIRVLFRLVFFPPTRVPLLLFRWTVLTFCVICFTLMDCVYMSVWCVFQGRRYLHYYKIIAVMQLNNAVMQLNNAVM